MLRRTLGWLLWSFDELACEASTMAAGRKGISAVEILPTEAAAALTLTESKLVPFVPPRRMTWRSRLPIEAWA